MMRQQQQQLSYAHFAGGSVGDTLKALLHFLEGKLKMCFPWLALTKLSS
eukprot:UN07250